MKPLYLITITTSLWGDIWIIPHFATLDKEKAEKWVERFNRIVEDNRERLNNFDLNSSDNTPFWHDYILYENPWSSLKEIKLI